jgi:hypothetical protein
MTVFMYSRPNWPVKHNDVYWDDAFLSMDNSFSVTAPPLFLLAQQDVTQTVTHTVQIQTAAGFTWTAVFQPQGTITPTITPVTGTGSASLHVGLDSSGLLTGTYTNTLTLSAAGTVGGPFTLPVRVRVVDALQFVYLPVVLK